MSAIAWRPSLARPALQPETFAINARHRANRDAGCSHAATCLSAGMSHPCTIVQVFSAWERGDVGLDGSQSRGRYGEGIGLDRGHLR